MGNINLSGIGPELKIQQGSVPAAVAAGTRNGTGFSRKGFNSCVLEAQTGALSGAPTGQTVDVKLQHSDVVGSGYVDYTPGGVAANGAVAQITAAITRKRKSIDLRGAKEFIRTVEVTGFTGGTSPTIGAANTVILGGADVLPAQADD